MLLGLWSHSKNELKCKPAAWKSGKSRPRMEKPLQGGGGDSARTRIELAIKYELWLLRLEAGHPRWERKRQPEGGWKGEGDTWGNRIEMHTRITKVLRRTQQGLPDWQGEGGGHGGHGGQGARSKGRGGAEPGRKDTLWNGFNISQDLALQPLATLPFVSFWPFDARLLLHLGLPPLPPSCSIIFF